MQVYELKHHLGDKDRYTGVLAEFARTKVIQLRLAAGAEIREHRTSDDVLIVVLKGRVVFRFGEKKAELGPYRLLHIPPDEPHSLRAIEDLEALLIRIGR